MDAETELTAPDAGPVGQLGFVGTDMEETTCDILGLGVLAVDDLLYVKAYPSADTKTRVSARERQCGGLTGTALIAAARLGATCAYAGMLGADELSSFVTAALKAEGVDVTHVVARADARPVHSVVVVDETRHTRTILYDVSGTTGADPELPAADVIRSAKVLFVDQYGVDGMIRAVKIARSAGRGVVADFEHRGDSPRFDELLAGVDHPILPLDFARELTGANDPSSAVKALWHDGADTVAVTCGADGVFYVTTDAPTDVRHQPAFRVETVDTTGCGDVFHGVYAAALARGLAAEERVRLAAAAAAIKSTQPGGQKGIPDLPTVESFLAERSG